jgi:hypothetical protein
MLCNIALLVASIAALFPQLKTGMIAIAGTSVLLLLYALKAKRHKP